MRNHARRPRRPGRQRRPPRPGRSGLDHTLAALGEPARRAVIDLLRQAPRRPSELAEALAMSRPAISSHLGVLRRAGLVEPDGREEDARKRRYRLRRKPFAEVRGWLEAVEAFWEGQPKAGLQGRRRPRRFLAPRSAPAPMNPAPANPVEDAAEAAVVAALPPAEAFQAFTAGIDRWWPRGSTYRVAGQRPGTILLDPRVGGRLVESWPEGTRGQEIERARVTVWEPPARLVFQWGGLHAEPSERTEAELTFEPDPGGTRVTVIHRGWTRLRLDHPARQGLDSAAFLRRVGEWWASLLNAMRQHAESRSGP